MRDSPVTAGAAIPPILPVNNCRLPATGAVEGADAAEETEVGTTALELEDEGGTRDDEAGLAEDDDDDGLMED